MHIRINRTMFELVEGDITQLETEAIVNAANERLAHGGGVAGVISRAGGPTIQRESNDWVRKHGAVKTGSAAITSGGNLKSDYVIHAVGPVYNAVDNPAELLASAVKSSLRMADKHVIKSIALPAISTGIFGYPMEEAATIMLGAAIKYLKENPRTDLERVAFCLYGQSAFDTFANALRDHPLYKSGC